VEQQESVWSEPSERWARRRERLEVVGEGGEESVVRIGIGGQGRTQECQRAQAGAMGGDDQGAG
jgi:hypothetical protein